MNEFPHKCFNCGSPSFNCGPNIDCSNPNCVNKYKTSGGLDLFMPKNLQPINKNNNIKVIKKKYITCPFCKSTENIAAGLNGSFVCRTSSGTDHIFNYTPIKNDLLYGNDKFDWIFNGDEWKVEIK